MSSPTQRTLKYLRDEGWTCQVVEKFNHYSRTRQDLFGCIDILAIRDYTLGVQACITGDMRKREAKAMELPGLRAWLNAGNSFAVIGWAKYKPRGIKIVRWRCTIREIVLRPGGALDVLDVTDANAWIADSTKR